MRASAERESYLAERPFPYCKGCGHGLVARRLNEALIQLKLEPSQIVLTSDIGCVGLVDPLFPGVHTVHTIHGRSTAIATGAVLADRLLGEGRMKSIVMIGDGGATIGLLHLAQAALMNIDLTVLLHNNLLYGMTGGQHSAFSPEGFVTTTTPRGNWVPSLDMEQLLQGCQGGFFARQLATDAELADIITEAIRYPGFALVEILELCPGYGIPLNRMDGKSLRRKVEADGRQWGVRIKRADRRPFHDCYRQGVLSSARHEETEATRAPSESFSHRVARQMGIVIAGSAGERVQSAAFALCQAAVLCNLFCTQKNDYPVTVGSGFSISEMTLSPAGILYTGVERLDAILIASADGLREVRSRGDLSRLASAGLVIADQSLAPELPGDRLLSLPLRRQLSPTMAALGAVTVLIARTGILDKETLVQAVGILASGPAAPFYRAIEAAWGLGG